MKRKRITKDCLKGARVRYFKGDKVINVIDDIFYSLNEIFHRAPDGCTNFSIISDREGFYAEYKMYANTFRRID